MSERPYMKFWIKDYIADTNDLDMSEHGAFILLLMDLWKRDGVLRFDRSRLLNICHARKRGDWLIIQRIIAKFFTVDEAGFMHNKRLTEELNKARSLGKVRAEAGAAGGGAKAANARSETRDYRGELNSTNSHRVGAEKPNDNNDGALANDGGLLGPMPNRPDSHSSESKREEETLRVPPPLARADKPMMPPTTTNAGIGGRGFPGGDVQFGSEGVPQNLVADLDGLAQEMTSDDQHDETDEGLLDAMTAAAAPVGQSWTHGALAKMVDTARRASPFWTNDHLVGLAAFCREHATGVLIKSPKYLEASSGDYTRHVSALLSQPAGTQPDGRSQAPTTPRLSPAEQREAEADRLLASSSDALARQLAGSESGAE